MISIKKYLDMVPGKTAPESDLNDLSAVILECYRAALLVMANSSARACPAVGSDLQNTLATLENRLSAGLTSALIKETEAQVEEQLLKWGGSTAEYFKTKANEVKEILLVLARTAESMGQRDQRYADHFTQLTAQLQTIADLEDLAQVRSSLVQRAVELKTYIDKMAQESQESVQQLRAEVSTYESKLKAAEQIALQDPLTGLANRRKIEERIEWRIEHNQTFCILILDLNRFKKVNDIYGHNAGDNLLQQFFQELLTNCRSTDIVGRWGGDEFLVVLDCDLNTAQSQVERLQKWALGEYTIPRTPGSQEAKVTVDASVGLAQWQAGQSLKELIASADSAMYAGKTKAQSQNA